MSILHVLINTSFFILTPQKRLDRERQAWNKDKEGITKKNMEVNS
jgi:hypothetical protein